MPTETIGGLYGKARRERVRNRAARLYTRQLVEEYLERDEPSARAERYVPIRGRGEFLPSAATELVVDPVAERADEVRSEPPRQLDLEFAEAKAPRTVLAAAPSIAAAPESRESPEPPVLLRIPGPAKPRHEPSLTVPRVPQPRPFTFGGFLLGCAMGSAAAVMGLVVVQTVVH